MLTTSHPTVFLFDIDGTLVSIGGTGRRAMERAFEKICGSKSACPSISFGGLTDRGIVANGLSSVGMEASETRILTFFDAYHGFLREEISNSPPADALPGSRPLLEKLTTVRGTALGLGTGNTRTGAFTKLEAVNLESFFYFGGFGCDHPNRTELIKLGGQRGAKLLGIEVSEARLVVIGDTPKDIHAAREAGAECLAIATGEFSVDELKEFKPTAVFPNLEAPDLLRALMSPNLPD